MVKRWNVYHGSDHLGLKTAKEIREALRQGTLDPFDKVSLEGSNIREDLVEVDEIFKESPDEEAEFENDVKSVAGDSVGSRTNVALPAAPPAAAPTPAASSTPNPNTNGLGMQIGNWRNEASIRREELEQKPSRNTDKRFYLIDKAKILGPLNALEIQSLFNRGLLNPKVKVQKIGNTKSISIAQFIASFSEGRIKELTDVNRIPQNMGAGGPSSKVLNELARAASAKRLAKDRKNKTYLLLVIAGLVLGILVYFIYDSSSSPSRPPRPGREQTSREDKQSRPKLLQRQAEEPERERNERPERVERPAPVRAPSPRTPPRAPNPPERSKPKKVVVAPPPAPRPVPVARPKPAAAPAPAPAPEKRESVIAKAKASGGGRIQTVGPVSFSMAALEGCASKCTLTLRDGSGATMKAVFFKSAYYEALKSRSNAVYLTGNTKVEGGDLTIFIQDVR